MESIVAESIVEKSIVEKPGGLVRIGGMKTLSRVLWSVLLGSTFFVPLASVAASASGPSPEALALRDRGFAELENEHPEKAEVAYRELAELLPEDPLPHANLAIALLRQQQYDAARQALARALAQAPGRGDVMAIEAEIDQWEGDLEGALERMGRALDAAPRNLEILYSTYQLATTARSETAEALADKALDRLAKLRPENVVVLLQLGQRAIAAGDRPTATAAYARVAQLLWQADPIATRAMEMVSNALRQDDLESARVPAVRLENVLKISAMFRESLRELKTGIQGIPLRRLRGEPEPTAFGDPIAITLAAVRLDPRPTLGRALAVGDFDGDQRPDIARLIAGGTTEGGSPGWRLVVRASKAGLAGKTAEQSLPALGASETAGLLATDLDNDGHLDLLAFGGTGMAFFGGSGDGAFERRAGDLGLGGAAAAAAAVIDFDIEGDLDLVLVGGGEQAVDLWRNNLAGDLEAIGRRSIPGHSWSAARDVVVSDLDRDGDLDLVVAHGGGLAWLDNLRQGRFIDRTAEVGLSTSDALTGVVATDLDHDGRPDLITAAGQGLVAWHNLENGFEPWRPPGLASDAVVRDLLVFEGDNDGRPDLALATATGVRVLGRTGEGGFVARTITGGPTSSAVVAAGDFDGDGDLDLVAGGPEGLHRLDNRGGNGNHWLDLRLRGLAQGNSKNNLLGVGSVVEVHNGRAYQFHEMAGDVLHLGLGKQDNAEVLRVVWTNGVPQNRLALAGNQQIVEEQLLKGSCPFLYVWNGQRIAFVTDLLWGAPLGLPVAPGVWASSDPSELVRVDGAKAEGGVYDLRITEELWEAAFFDHVRLWVVDHPAEVEVASNLRIVPGESFGEEVRGSREVRPMAAAWDGEGREVTTVVARRDEVYADGYRPSPYQGVAAEPWSFTFDLGQAPGAPVRLLLDGWIFPADASLNLAVAQRDDLPYLPPRLEVETAEGWRVLAENVGFPAGKTKTLVIDTPPLPVGVRKLRLVSTLWLHWDRLAWTLRPDDAAPTVVARLLPDSAELRFRGFSQLVRQAPNAPHAYDYARRAVDSPWLPFPGRYTRYGDVRPLLAEPDDLSVILAPGDEMALRFETHDLPPVAEGYVRTLFLESHGWDKDADRNTFEPRRLEPLPFRAMTGYPWGEGEHYPDSPEHRRYRDEWLTREVVEP